MAFKSDIEIAQETTMQHITEVAKTAGVDAKYLEQYGNYKAKVDYKGLRCYTSIVPIKYYRYCAVSHFNGSCIHPVGTGPMRTAGTNLLQGE